MKALIIIAAIILIFAVAKHYQLLATIPIAGSWLLLAVILGVVVIVKLVMR